MRWAAAPAVILVVFAVSTRANYETTLRTAREQISRWRRDVSKVHQAALSIPTTSGSELRRARKQRLDEFDVAEAELSSGGRRWGTAQRSFGAGYGADVHRAKAHGAGAEAYAGRGAIAYAGGESDPEANGEGAYGVGANSPGAYGAAAYGVAADGAGEYGAGGYGPGTYGPGAFGRSFKAEAYAGRGAIAYAGGESDPEANGEDAYGVGANPAGAYGAAAYGVAADGAGEYGAGGYGPGTYGPGAFGRHFRGYAYGPVTFDDGAYTAEVYRARGVRTYEADGAYSEGAEGSSRTYEAADAYGGSGFEIARGHAAGYLGASGGYGNDYDSSVKYSKGSFGSGGFGRLSPYEGRPYRGQGYGSENYAAGGSTGFLRRGSNRFRMSGSASNANKLGFSAYDENEENKSIGSGASRGSGSRVGKGALQRISVKKTKYRVPIRESKLHLQKEIKVTEQKVIQTGREDAVEGAETAGDGNADNAGGGEAAADGMGSITKVGLSGMGGEMRKTSDAETAAAGAEAAGAKGADAAGTSVGAGAEVETGRYEVGEGTTAAGAETEAGAAAAAVAGAADAAAKGSRNATSKKAKTSRSDVRKKTPKKMAAAQEQAEAEAEATGRYRRSAKGVASGATGATKRGSALSSAAAALKASKFSKSSAEDDDQLDSSFEGLHGRRIGTPTDHDQDEYDEDHEVRAYGGFGSYKKKSGGVKLRTAMEMEEQSFGGMYGRRGGMKSYAGKSLTDNEPGVMDEMEGLYGRRGGALAAGPFGAAAAAGAMAAAQFQFDGSDEGSFEGLHGRRIGTPTRTDYDEEDDDFERYRYPSQQENRGQFYSMGSVRSGSDSNNKKGSSKKSHSKDSGKKGSSKDKEQDCAGKGLEQTLRLPDDPEKVKLYIARVLQRLQKVLLQGTKRNA